MKHVFIINPVSGKKQALHYREQIKEYFKDQPEAYCIEITQYVGHAREMAREYAQRGNYRIYAIGGDGTLNEVLSGLAGTQSVLGVLPGGSCNDFFRSLSEGKSQDILKKTIEGPVIPIDYGRLGEAYFIIILSVGIDADTAAYASQLTRKYRLTGKLTYFLALVRVLFKHRLRPHYHIKLTLDNERVIEQEVLICVCTNGKYYGGGFLPIPFTRLDDGYFDICYVDHKSFWYILRTLPLFMKGRHIGVEGVHFERARKIKIESEKEMCINKEGEIIRSKTVEVQMCHHAVHVINPSSSGVQEVSRSAAIKERIS